MTDRRKDDERIELIATTVTELKVLVEQVHKCMFGSNGNPGLNREFERMKGGLSVFKFLAGSGGAVGIIALLITLYKLFSGN